MRIDAEVNLEGDVFNGAKVQEGLRKALRGHLLGAALDYQGAVEQRTPFGVTGALRRGWITELVSDSEAVVYNTEEYALAVEEGRRPGKGIPIEPLQLWVRRVLGLTNPVEIRSVAFLISRKAKLKGLEGQFFAADTFNDMLPAMNAELAKVGASIIKELEQ